jgi:predicted RNase H-like nuclease (RuvC/YqgF family)
MPEHKQDPGAAVTSDRATISHLNNRVKELEAEVESLTAEIETLEAKVEKAKAAPARRGHAEVVDRLHVVKNQLDSASDLRLDSRQFAELQAEYEQLLQDLKG